MIATSESTFLLSELTDQTEVQRDNVSLCLVEHKHSENEISLPSHTRRDLGTEVSWTYAPLRYKDECNRMLRCN